MPQLIPLAQFERTGRSPVNMRWLIFHQKEQLQEIGALIRFGSSRWLVDEERLIGWLREMENPSAQFEGKQKKEMRNEKSLTPIAVF